MLRRKKMFITSKRAISNILAAAIIIVVIVVAIVGVAIAIPSLSKTVTTTATSTSIVTTTTSSTKPTSSIKLALLVGGDATDDGLNDQGIQVANWIASTYGWTVSISTDVAYSDQQAVMTSYAQEGYNVIWTDGNQFIGATETVAAQFPHTYFIMTPTYDGDTQCGSAYTGLCSNIVALSAGNQATGYYQAGVLAGKMTKTNATGVIIGQWFTALSLEFYAYSAGVHASNPSAKTYLTVPGTWSDPTIGYTDAQTMVKTDDVDILVPIADTTGLGVISYATANNITLIGTVLDQVVLSPTDMMTSVLLNMTAFIQPVVNHINAGTWSQIGGKVEDLNLGSLGPFHNYASKIPASVTALLATTSEGINDGTIKVPFTYTPSAPTCPSSNFTKYGC